MNAAEWGKRVAALVLAAAVVVAIASAGAAVSQNEGTNDEPLDNSEYRVADVSVDPMAAEGSVEPDRSAVDGSGTVVIDDGHGNRFSRSDIQPLVEGLTRVGYDVEFYSQGDLGTSLEDAKAFVVIDPGQEYKSGDIDDVRRFTGQGGRLLLVGEPDRVSVGGGLFGLTITRQESTLTTLGASYGMSVDTAYLYNQENADTNHQFITAEPGPNADLEGIDRTTMYTAASVRARGGTTLLRSAPNTRRSNTDDESGQYPVAVRKNDVVLLGDKTFMGTDRYNVADNERFVAYLVEFLATGERTPGTPISTGEDEGAGNVTGTNESDSVGIRVTE